MCGLGLVGLCSAASKHLFVLFAKHYLAPSRGVDSSEFEVLYCRVAGLQNVLASLYCRAPHSGFTAPTMVQIAPVVPANTGNTWFAAGLIASQALLAP